MIWVDRRIDSISAAETDRWHGGLFVTAWPEISDQICFGKVKDQFINNGNTKTLRDGSKQKVVRGLQEYYHRMKTCAMRQLRDLCMSYRAIGRYRLALCAMVTSSGETSKYIKAVISINDWSWLIKRSTTKNQLINKEYCCSLQFKSFV